MSQLTDISVDPICSEFPQWHGRAPAGFDVNFLGQLTDVSFNAGWADAERTRDRDAWPPYPRIDEEIFEWRHLFSAILEARNTFTMIEGGCGYGRWLIAAACALRRCRPQLAVSLMGIEAEEKHFQWLHKHFRDNGIDPADHHPLFGAVEDYDGKTLFVTGHSAEWYGQYVVNSPADRFDNYRDAQVREVPAYSIPTLLSRFERVDLMDLDIQMSEVRAIPAGIGEMTRKVRRVFVETHGHQIHDVVSQSFKSHGWLCVEQHGFACPEFCCQEITRFGPIMFDGGLQCWINPAVS